MSTPEEMRKIMRGALEKQRDQALASMSAIDQRLVNISSKPKLDEVQADAQAAFRKALFWPTAQAIVACAIIGCIFALAALSSLNGHTPSAITGPVTTAGGIVALLSLAQFAYLSRRR